MVLVFDVKKAEKILQNVNSVVVKLVNPTNEMKEFEKLKNFGVNIQYESGEPSIIIEKGEVSITYMATPIQMEFEPFLRTIKRISEDFFDEKLKIKCKGEVLVFIAPMCPHCAKVVENLNMIAIVNPNIKCKIVDVTLYPDLSETYEVTSAPTVVIRNNEGKEVKLTGEMETEELLNWIRKVLCGEDYAKEYYSIMLKERKMENVLKEVENDEDKLSTVAEIIENGEMMAKIGAMLLLEKVYEKDPKKLVKVKEKLKSIIERGDSVAVQDAAFILGKIGDESDLEILNELLKSKDEDIKEAAEEAIEEIKERLGSKGNKNGEDRRVS